MTPYYDSGGITIFHGDCREVLPLLDPVDLVLTSPPYLQARDYGQKIGNWDELVPPAIAATPAKPDTQIIVNLGMKHADGHVLTYWDALTARMKADAWRLFGWYVWDQGSGLPGDWNGRLAPSHEFLFHYNREAVKLNKTVACIYAGDGNQKKGIPRRANGSLRTVEKTGKLCSPYKIPDTVVRVRRTHNFKDPTEHPATFPEVFAQYVLAAFPGQTILDPFMGSGTTLRAAKDLGRQAIGIELEERYCEIAAERLRQGVLAFA